jgi:hypothetical protein
LKLNFAEEKFKAVHRLAWTIGRLDYRLRESQKQIKAAWVRSQETSRKFYINSTRRLGKSSFLLHLMVEQCIKKAKSRWAFFAPVKDGLLDYIEPIIQETLKWCPDDLRPKFDKQRFMFSFANGSTILFRGSNNQQHRIRRGLDLDGAGVDEGRDVDDLKELVDSVIFPALFSSDGYLLISSTPADTYSHDLYTYYQMAQSEGWLYECDIDQAAKLDPEDFPVERIAEWKKETQREDVWEREYKCKWIIDSTRVAVPEWRAAYCKGYYKDIFYPFYHHYIGIDWGSKDFTALIFATWDFKRAKLVVEGELTFSGTEVRSDKIAAAITMMKFKLWGEDAEIYKTISDSADPILINELNAHAGMNCIPVYKERSLEAMLNQFRILVAAEKIEVSPKCAMLVSNLSSAVWDKLRVALDKDPYNHHFDHLMALVYLTRGLVPNENPIPKDFGVDGTRIIDLNFDKKQVSLGAQALEEAYSKVNRTRRFKAA